VETNVSDISDKLIKTIRALMAKAEGTTNEHEAATFAAKVQELLSRHNLSMENVRAENDDSVDMFTQKDEFNSPARRRLFWAVCRFYMCKGVAPGRGGGHWTIFGRRHNVVVAVEMGQYLVRTVIRLSKDHARQWGAQNKDMIDFRRGAFIRLCERLDEMTARAMQADKPQWSGENPLNLPALFTSEKALIESVQAAKGFESKHAKKSKLKHGLHAVLGRRAADDIGLHTQVGKDKGAGRLAIGKQ
jgi:hypothetical protein